MLIGYARVSTQDQTLRLQHDALTDGGCEKLSGTSTTLPADRMKVDGENRFAEGQETSKADGGLIRTNLDYNIALNKDSSLRREWVAVHDNLPLMIVGTPSSALESH